MKSNPIHSVSFKAHYVNVDIGASSKLGSLKICAKDELSGNTIAKSETTVFSPDEERSEEAFEQNLAKKIAQFENENKQEILKHDPENAVKLTVCYPGAKISSEDAQDGFVLSNFYYDNLGRERFKRPISPDMIDTYIEQKGINISQTRHANDMAGAGACLLSKLKKEYPEVLKEGKEIVYLYPGGGLGSGLIAIGKNNYRIKPTEIQHIRKLDGGGKSLEADVGAPGLRANFKDALELTDSERALLGENTKAVDNFDEFHRILPYIPKEEHTDALRTAIDKYISSLAQLIATKICDCKMDTVVITGPIANSLRNTVNNNPEFKFDANPCAKDRFAEMLKRKIVKKLTPVGRKLMGNPKDFNIIFLKLKNNTEGAELLQDGAEVGNPTAWYDVSKN